MSTDYSGGAAVDHVTSRLLVDSVQDGNEARVVESLDKIGWHALDSVHVSLPYYAQLGWDAESDTGTLLHVACWHQQPKLVKLFLERNAKPDEKSRERHESPLHISAGHGDEESCALLISYGCTVDAVDVEGETPLSRASLHGHDNVVKLLIKHNADVNHRDRCGWIPLHDASFSAKTSTVQILAKSGSDVDCQDKSKTTPLHLACKRGKTGIVKLLVRRGADVTIADNNQKTALFQAVTKGHLQTAHALISSIPDPTLINDALQRNLELALEWHSLELLSFVCAHGALDGADDKIKSEAVEFAMERIPRDSGMSHSVSLDRVSLYKAFQLAEGENGVLTATIVVAAGAFRDSSQDRFAEVLQHAIQEDRVELAMALLKSVAFKVEDKKLLCDTFDMATNEESTQLALAVMRHKALPVEGTPAPLQDQTPYVLWDALGSANVEFIVDLCHATRLIGAGSQTVADVLAVALQNKSVELASIVLRTAGVSPEEHAPSFIHAAANVTLATSSVELAILVCHRPEFFTASTTVVNKILQLGLDSKSIELEMAVLSKAAALNLNHESVDLVLAVASKVAADTSIPGETLITLLEFAVKHKSAQLAMLVCNAGAVIEADLQLLASALEMAIEVPRVSSNELVLLLSKAGVLQLSSDKVKEKALRKAAITGDFQLADQCISSGALHGADHWNKPTAIDIATRRGHSRLAEKLKKALENYKLLSLGQRDANTVLIRVAGSPGAGKSTLVKSLRRSRLSGVFRRENQPDEDDRNFKTRTRGISLKSYEDSNGTQYRILDLGGQEDFAAANQLFIGEGKVPIVNIITISSLKHYAKMEAEVLKWSAFFASRKNSPSASEPEVSGCQPVIFAATRSESASSDQVDSVRRAAQQAEVSFGKFLDFRHGAVFVDARKSWSHGMEKLRRLLADVTKEVLQGAPPQAALCNDIQRALPRIRATIQRPIISRKELPELVAQGLSSRRRSFDQSVIESHTDLLDAALQQMSDACEVLAFDAPELKDVLVIQPPWLLHKVVGVLLSPANFPPPRLHYNRNGRAKRQQAEEALKANFGPLLEQYETLHMVAELGLCILDEEQDKAGADEHIVVPSKLEISRDLQALLLAGNYDSIWFGIELLCSEVPLSVCLFPQLQAHLHNYLRKQCKQKPMMWSGGIAVALSHQHVVGIVEARHGRMAIDIIIQGTKATRRVSYCLLQTLQEQTLFKIEKFSPGSDISEKILSSRELSEIDWSKSHHVPKITYERDYAEKAIEHGQIRPHHEDESLCWLEDAFELMAIPERHLALMTTDGYDSFCHKLKCPPSSGEKTAKWQELARRLGMPEHRISSVASAGTTNPTDVILQWWSRCSAQHTIDRLLAVVKGMRLPEAAAILEKELTYSLNILPAEPDLPSEPSAFDSASPDGHDDGPSLPLSSPSSVEEHRLQPVADSISDPTQPVREENCSQPENSLLTSPLFAEFDEHEPVMPVLAMEQGQPPASSGPEESLLPNHGSSFASDTTWPDAPPSPAFVNDCQGQAHTDSPLSPLPDSVTEHCSPSVYSTDHSPLPDPGVEPSSSPSTLPDLVLPSALVEEHISFSAAATETRELRSPSASNVAEQHPSRNPIQDCTNVPPSQLPGCAMQYSPPPRPLIPVSDLVAEREPIPAHTQEYDQPLVQKHASPESDFCSLPPGARQQCPQADWFVLPDENLAGTAVALPDPFINKQRQSHPNAAREHHMREEKRDASAADGLFVDVAKMFYDTFECKQLAVYLEISQGGRIISILKSANPRMAAPEMAYEIMKMWKREKGSEATSKELRRVLRDKLKKVDAAEHLWPDGEAVATGDSLQSSSTSGKAIHPTTPLHMYGYVDKVPETTIMDIALSFSESYSCVQLAVSLELSQGSGFVVDSNPHASNREIAYDVMMEWKKEKGSAATGDCLYYVLHEQTEY